LLKNGEETDHRAYTSHIGWLNRGQSDASSVSPIPQITGVGKPATVVGSNSATTQRSAESHSGIELERQVRRIALESSANRPGAWVLDQQIAAGHWSINHDERE